MKKFKGIGILVLICSLVGNIFAVTYTYDDLNRLQKVEYDSGTIITYEYDEAGNIKKISVISTREDVLWINIRKSFIV